MQSTSWDSKFANRTKLMTSSAIRELLKVAARPEVIAFGGGMPAPEFFPRDEVLAACERVLKDTNLANQALQYSVTEGYQPLREWIAEFMDKDGVKVDPNNVLITGGSQQALDMIGKIFINEGDKVVVESPTYMGALQAWSTYNPKYEIIPSDQNGLNPDGLEVILKKNPKFVYVLSNYQNPTGVTITLDRREKLVEIASKHSFPMVEDDPYGALYYEAKPLPTLFDLECRKDKNGGNENGNILYLSTFSKILTPGFRLAWMVAPSNVIAKFVQAKQGMDLQTNTFAQYVAYEVAHTGFLNGHIAHLREVYRHRRDVMLECLEEDMPQGKGITWTHPLGGLFLWITLPSHMSSTKLLEDALKENVAFVPGDSFHPNGGGQNTMRLNFSFMPEDRIAEGIGRLGKIIKKTI